MPAFLIAVSLLASPMQGSGDSADLARQAQQILRDNCYRCHGQEGANEGGFNYVTDLARLVERRKVTPGDSGKSRLMKRLLDPDDPMPPPDEKVRPSAADIAVLKKWIDAGAPALQTTPQRAFLSTADMLEIIRADLDGAAARDRPFLRYFTLVHLHNAGLAADELLSYRHGLSKLVNHLSWGKRVVVPVAVGDEKAVLRIDLRDYQWNEKTWETIAAHNPYGVAYASAAAKACADMTRCELPYVRADWFVAVAARPPLYHDVLALPRTEAELEKLLRVDVAENIRQERVARAGFNGSGVSRNNRLIERHESSGAVYWKSYDFAGNTGRQNLFAHPLGPDDGDESSFRHDGGEIIFSLPNGLQGYFLTDARGTRIDKGPQAIVSDPRRPDRAVENGLSCMSCHARGIIDKADQVRGHVRKSANGFAQSVFDKVEALYPPPDTLSALMRADAKRFLEATARTGAPLSATEPISALATRFEAELDLGLVAAEAGVRSPELLAALERSPPLAKVLGPLRVEGGTIQRQVFVDVFQEMIETLRVGAYVPARSGSADKLVRLGLSLAATEPARALEVLGQALEQEPGNALAHAGCGDAHRFGNDPVQAIAAYTEALRLEPRSATVLNNRGLMFQRRGEHDKALTDFAAALRLEPRFAVAYYNRGTIHYARGELDRAIADYDEALRLDAKFARAFNNRGYAYLDKNDLDRARADFDQAIRLEPGFAAAWNNRGLVHLKKDRTAAAIADFSQALKLDAKFAQAWYNRGLAHSKAGNAALAAADRKQALALDPNLDD